jgi:hypothetical protein
MERLTFVMPSTNTDLRSSHLEHLLGFIVIKQYYYIFFPLVTNAVDLGGLKYVKNNSVCAYGAYAYIGHA